MTSISDDDLESRGLSDRRHGLMAALAVPSWMLWSRPKASIAFVLALDALAVAVIGPSLVRTAPTHQMLLTAGLLVLGALAQNEATRHIERARRVISGTVHINTISVWVFAAVLTLPTGWAGAITAIISCHVVLRSYNLARSYTHRQVMNAAAMILAGWGARAVLNAGGVPPISIAPITAEAIALIIGAALVFFAIDAALIAASLILDMPLPADTPRSPRDIVGSVDDNVLELATISLGALTGVVVVSHPVALVLVFLPLFVLHRSTLVKQLEEQATHDQKTGLLNAVAWNATAQRELDRADRHSNSLAVLMVDLDHFKRVNDVHGHLAGDAVLQAVAGTIQQHVRDYDSVGRFGGEEFVVLLPAISPADVGVIAERVRHAITQINVEVPQVDDRLVLSGLSASIGIATYPSAGTVVDALVHAADTALYHAKNTGRNKVVSVADLTESAEQKAN